jgi:hypothetical protein
MTIDPVTRRDRYNAKRRLKRADERRRKKERQIFREIEEMLKLDAIYSIGRALRDCTDIPPVTCNVSMNPVFKFRTEAFITIDLKPLMQAIASKVCASIGMNPELGCVMVHCIGQAQVKQETP